MAYQLRKQIPRYRSFSLGDFKEFDRCSFSFFVKHHLQKKYDLEEGSANKALGSLLDLTIKKIHQAGAYDQPIEFLVNIVKASELEMREKAKKEGERSYFGPQIPFLTPETLEKAKSVLRGYHSKLNGKLKRSISRNTFWEYGLIASDGEDLRLWGGPDSIELGTDGMVEIVDYKFRERNLRSSEDLKFRQEQTLRSPAVNGDLKYFENQGFDMDLMPKLYTLLVAQELLQMGYKKVRFRIRLWLDPQDESLYEEFDLDNAQNLAGFFQEKAERILRTTELTFCQRDFCKVCHSDQKASWIEEIQLKSWLK